MTRRSSTTGLSRNGLRDLPSCRRNRINSPISAYTLAPQAGNRTEREKAHRRPEACGDREGQQGVGRGARRAERGCADLAPRRSKRELGYRRPNSEIARTLAPVSAARAAGQRASANRTIRGKY